MRIIDLFGMLRNARFFADEGGGGGETPDWHADFPCLAGNKEASGIMAKYKDPDSAMSAAVEAQQKVGRAFWLPDDHSKLTETQKADIRANVAKMENLPLTADGYKIKIAEGTKTPIDDQGMADFKVFCKEKDIPQALAQDLVNLQNVFADRTNESIIKNLNQEIKDRNVKVSAQFSLDCGGDAQAIVRREMIKGLLQSMCKNAEGEPDPKMWEAFEKQFDEKGIDLPLLRALSEPALAASNAGTLPAGGGKTTQTGEGTYDHMT